MSKRMLAGLTLALLAACAQGPPQPVEIDAADSCDFCKMAISQKQYAAELIDSEHTFKFDDIGCMVQFARERGLIGAAPSEKTYLYVRDYDNRQWLIGNSARFVQSSRIPTPMASGLIALADRQKAETYAAKFGGRILEFAEVWKP